MRTLVRRAHRITLACALLLAAAPPTAAHAQSALGGSIRAPGDTLAAVAPGSAAAAWSVGSSRAVIDSAEIATAAATTLSELIQARAASVSVLRSGGLLSDGAQLRMRGPTSVVGAVLPLLVVDGVPMDDAADDSLATAARLDDIPLADVARVELLRGPAAAALYGAGAAAGVIVVTTRDAGAHALRWRATGAADASRSSDGFGNVYNGIGTWNVDGRPTSECGLFVLATQQCTQSSIQKTNRVAQSGMLRTGAAFTSSVEGSGGTGSTRARISVARSDASGVVRDDEASSTSARLDVTQRIVSSLHATARVGVVRGRAQPSRSGSAVGTAINWMGPADTLGGLRARIDSLFQQPSRVGHLDHLTTALALDWRPWSAIGLHGLASRDRVDEHGSVAIPLPQGATTFNDTGTTTRTLRDTRLELEATHHVARAAATLIAGVEHQHASWGERNAAWYGGAAFSILRRWLSKANTNAAYAQERLAWGDRAAVGGGLRYERDYLSGDTWRVYPTADATVLLARDLFGGAMRARAAYGEAPQRLGPCSPTSGSFVTGCDRSPERSREGEVGADVTFARAAVGLTAYRADVSGVWVPAGGSGINFSRERIRNAGVELDGRARVLDRPGARWDVGVTAATLSDRLEGTFPPQLSGPGMVKTGTPVLSAFRYGYTYGDANGDGIIETSEVQILPPYAVGPSTPTREISLRSSLATRGGITLGAIVDGRRGFYADERLEAYECGRQLCLATVDPKTPLGDQAAALAGAGTAMATHDASFWRLREVSARWRLPVRAAARLGAGDGALVVAGRDLATWTSFPQGDPETNDLARDAVSRAILTAIPLPRQLMIRVELDYGVR